VLSLPQTYHRLRNRFGRTRWYSLWTRLKWILVSVYLEIVLILMQDRSTVWAEHNIGSIVFFTDPIELLCDVGHGNVILVRSETVLVSVQDGCTVCAKRTIGLEIILDTQWYF
jgi:hypothetical protein